MSQSPLVTTEWLQNHLHDADLRIVDIRGHVLPTSEPHPHYFNHYDDYVKSHIPGAVFVDWVREITDPDDQPWHAQIAQPERYAAVMNRLGIGPDTLVVAYDDAHNMFAARLWWSLNYYGHDKVVVLDGGWKKWTAEGRQVTDEVPTVAPGNFAARANPVLKRDLSQVMDATHDPSVTLVDVRSPEEFAGKASRTSRKGHIPTAINHPTGKIYHEDDTFRSAEELRQQFAESGLSPDDGEIVTYCNGGVSASMGMLALNLAGYYNVAMYDGSWKNWSSDENNPIETE
ncbi:MAG: sulfurtransferase [Anaerolineae bacterium]|nr:sulfurtransferase [Anaerolineae bacterium]